MAKFIINGSKKLSGEIKISGSKNAVLPLIAASILIPEVHLTNVPHIKDVERMLNIISDMGGEYDWLGDNEVKIKTENIKNKPLSDEARKLRASTLFAGSVLARFREVKLPYPGGDIIGARPLDAHIKAFESLGVECIEDGALNFRADNIKGGLVVLEETSVTATENILMLASGVSEEVEIRLVATEPHVQCLANFLSEAGADIEGIGTTTLKVKNKVSASKIKFRVIPDELEVSGFSALAAATRSDIKISPIRTEFLDSVLLQLKKMNVNFSIEGDALMVKSPVKEYRSSRLQSGLYPNLVTDHLPPLAVLATQVKGSTLVHDWLYEARQSYLRELMKMGADITIMDPHRALIIGPTPLYGKDVASYDIRSGMAMIVAALVAKGRTTISDIEHIDRGYENLEERLKNIGADIERVD